MFKKLSQRLPEYKETFLIGTRLFALIWSFDKKIVILQITAMSIPAIIPFVNAYIYAQIINIIVSSLKTGPDFNQLFFLLGCRFITLIINYSAFSLQNYMEMVMWTKMPIYLYQKVLNKLTELDVERFEDSKFKDTLQRVREGYSWMPLTMYGNTLYSLQALLQMSIAFIAVASFNIFLAIGIVIAALPSFINQIYYSKVIWGVWSEHSPYRKKFWYLSELIQNREGIKELKIFRTAKRFLDEMTGIQKRFAKENLEAGNRRFKHSLGLNIFGSVLYILVEGFIAILALTGRITLGSLSYFTFVIWNFESGVFAFFSSLGRTFDQSLYVKDIFKVLDLPTTITSTEKALKIETNEAPTIEFINVDFAYPGTKKKILNNFSLTIKPGEKVAFVGENGAGKTTIIKLLARFYDVTNGEILINGINLKDIDLVSWHKTLGVIFQDFIKYEYTLAENIHFGKVYEDFSLEKVKKAAAQAGVDRVSKDLNKGYDQMLGLTFEGGTELSLGQWQKVALARAFLRDAPVLVLDEPTASIDAKAEKEIFDKVEKLGKDKTVIIISHRFSTVRNADVIYVMENGKIVESGNHKKLLNNKGIYAKLFNLQAERYK